MKAAVRCSSGLALLCQLPGTAQALLLGSSANVSGGTPGRSGSCGLGGAGQAGVDYVLDGAQLEAEAEGLSFRLSKALEDRDARTVALWGSVVRGLDEGDGWLRVGECYLPMALGGVPVVLPQRAQVARSQANGAGTGAELALASGFAARTAITSFIAGEGAEVRTWVECTIAAAGERPGSYDILVPDRKGQQQLLRSIPREGLRGRGAVGPQGPGGLEDGQLAEVISWQRGVVVGPGEAPGTLDVRSGGREMRGVALRDVRKDQLPSWLQQPRDPTVADRVPGQRGVCSGVEGCTRLLASCVAQKRRSAAQNCGGRCDAVFVGDSIIERLTGGVCYSAAPVKFWQSGQAFQEVIASRHPRSLVLGGGSDETPQTLQMLDEVLPALDAPKLFLLLTGTNNIPKGGGAAAATGVEAVVARLRRAHPGARVLLHALLPRTDDRDYHRWREHIEEANKLLAAFVARQRAAGAPVEFVDCSTVFRPAELFEEYVPDHLHPSAAGYRAWLGCLEPILSRALRGVGRAL